MVERRYSTEWSNVCRLMNNFWPSLALPGVPFYWLGLNYFFDCQETSVPVYARCYRGVYPVKTGLKEVNQLYSKLDKNSTSRNKTLIVEDTTVISQFPRAASWRATPVFKRVLVEKLAEWLVSMMYTCRTQCMERHWRWSCRTFSVVARSLINHYARSLHIKNGSLQSWTSGVQKINTEIRCWSSEIVHHQFKEWRLKRFTFLLSKRSTRVPEYSLALHLSFLRRSES
jgi:hypothetical protein